MGIYHRLDSISDADLQSLGDTDIHVYGPLIRNVLILIGMDGFIHICAMNFRLAKAFFSLV